MNKYAWKQKFCLFQGMIFAISFIEFECVIQQQFENGYMHSLTDFFIRANCCVDKTTNVIIVSVVAIAVTVVVACHKFQ